MGYFLEMNGTEATCVTCDAAVMDCSIPGVTLANMPIKPGGWRVGNDTTDIVECFNLLACTGNKGILATLEEPSSDGNTTANATSSRRRRRLSASEVESTFGDALCAPGHTGMLCGSCKPNWYGYGDQKLCVECVGETIGAGFIPLVVLIGLLVVAMVIHSIRKSGINVETALEGGMSEAINEKAAEKAEEAKEKLGGLVASNDEAPKAGKAGCALRLVGKVQAFVAGTKFKILISLWQILQGMGAVFSIPFPPFYTSAVNSVSGLIQIDVPSLSECHRVPTRAPKPCSSLDQVVEYCWLLTGCL